MTTLNVSHEIKQFVSRVLDRCFRAETAQTVSRAELGTRDGEVGYEPSRWLTFAVAIPHDWITENDVFLDVGCGKGRVLLQAARHPFKRVVGIERSEQLVSVTRKNIQVAERNLVCPVEIVCADATTWIPPNDLTVVYMYSPLRGDLMRAVRDQLTQLATRRGTPLRIVYVNPVEHQMLLEHPQISELKPPRALAMRMAGHPRGGIRRYLVRPTEAGAADE